MLILASASPRRQELLRNAGIECLVQPANVPEEVLPREAPASCAERLACLKARAVYSQQTPGQSQFSVLGADTIVVIDTEMENGELQTEILGKPSGPSDAARMLRQLSGRVHRVITGVCLLTPGPPPRMVIRHEITQVTMSEITDGEIHDYVGSGEPMDKAGAYGIQGHASRWIPRIEGCYFNVVGLPVSLVYRMLHESNKG